MHLFKDHTGEEWEVSLNIAVTKSIRETLGIDLHDLDKETMADITTKPETLVDIISLVCTPQIKDRGLDEFGFAERLIGDAIDSAYDALVKELVFISRHSQREIVAKAWQKVKQAERKVVAAQIKMIDSPETDLKIEKMIADVEEKYASL